MPRGRRAGPGVGLPHHRVHRRSHGRPRSGGA
jgi:hypothetical protein